jgi:hypothetical protein
MDLKTGDYVVWKWAGGYAEGKIVSIHAERAEIVSKGKKIVRNGNNENPALIIKHKSGNSVIKLLSEIESVAK